MKIFTPALKRALLLALPLISLVGCVSTPQGGRKFDPLEGAKRFDDNLDMTIDRMQRRTYDDRY